MIRMASCSKWLLGAALMMGTVTMTAQNTVMDPEAQSGGHGNITPADDGFIDRVNPREYAETHETANRVIPYPFRRQDDYMWSTRHWERIDIRERINHPLYYPLQDLPDRQSLYSCLLEGIQGGELQYIFRDDMFLQPVTRQEVSELMVIPVSDVDQITGQTLWDTIRIKSNNLVAWHIKSEWFFDKIRGEMVNRIIGIAPEVEDINPQSIDGNTYVLFWLWFPETRQILARNDAFNPGNRSQRMSFDNLFHKRMFNAVIYKEDNTYDRRIEDYKVEGMERLLESQAIKERLRTYEHDLWEF